MICPACKKDTRRTKNGLCIKCKVPIELFIYRNDGQTFKEFRLPQPERAIEVTEAVAAGETIIGVEGMLLTPAGSNPEIVLLSGKPRKRYKVIYRYDIPQHWVYCPDCHYQMFQNMILNTGYLEQEFTCSYCKCLVTFVFVTNAAIPHI